MGEPEVRDFFVSYTQADRSWAEWLAWELEAAGYTTLLQAWDMPAGTAFVHVMDQAVQRTRHTVLVLSSAYLRSSMAESEWRPGFVADPCGAGRRLLPVRIEDCQPTGLLSDRVYIDLVGLDEATARAKLGEEVADALRGHARPTSRPRFPRAPTPTPTAEGHRFPTALPPVWNVPYRRNPLFTGRERTLARLAEQLRQGTATAVTQAIQGGGGIGKTALATQYAYRHRSEFDTVWWIRAQEPATMVSDYAALATAQGLPEAGEADQQPVASAVRRWLDTTERWLMVLDNAKDPHAATGLAAPLERLVDLIPPVLHGQVLVTSRDAAWEEVAELAELDVLDPPDAVRFLLDRTGTTDTSAGEQVAELLGYLPLALEQAGAYTREARIGLAAYRDRLRQFPALTLARGRPRDRNPSDTVATTWQVSLDQVGQVPGAAALLEVCAFLAPEHIPRDLFVQALNPSPDDQTRAGWVTNPLALDDAVVTLRRFGLVKADEQELTVHRLLQQVVRDQLDPVAKTARVGVAVRLLNKALPSGGYDDPELWPVCARLLPHALVASEYADELEVEPLASVDLLGNMAGYLQRRARFAEARTLCERALSISESRLGAEHPATATSLNHLGIVLADQGDLDGARALFERALSIREARLGADHPTTARTLNNLAHCLSNQGDLDGARALLERTLAIQ